MEDDKIKINSKKNLTPAQKEQFKEWGKLGGRPKKEWRKIHQINIKFTADEYEKISFKAREENIKVSEYCRIILAEKKFPKAEQNKTLITYANNFSRISNFMKMGVFTAEEKKPLLDEIELVIAQIRDNIKW